MGEDLLSVVNVKMNFGGVHALRGVDLKVEQGEILGLIGPNGSGKTTLVNCASGVLKPTEGWITFNGKDITSWSRPRRARAGLLRTFQNLKLFNELTVCENVAAGLNAREGRTKTEAQTDQNALRTLLAELHLDSFQRTRAADLSYGQQRRVEIARALAGEPLMLLLDEPAAGLSDAETEELREFLINIRNRYGCGILIIDHDMTFIMRLCTRVAVLDEGGIIFSGTPEEAQKDNSVLECYLGGETSVESEFPGGGIACLNYKA